MTGIRHIAASEVLARVADPAAPRAPLAFERGTLRVKLYAPRGHDPQEPHEQDEVYVVLSGSGRFVGGAEALPFKPGDVLFAAARAPHRFEDFTDDLAVWVFFYGPAGGEVA